MKNTRRGGPGGCAFPIWKRGFSGHRPGSGARRTFSVLHKRRLSEGETAVRQGRSDCGTGCGQRENGKFNRTNITKKLRFLQKISKNRNFFGPSGGI